MTRDLVAVGTSWGGLHALRTLFSGLPSDLPAAIVVVQHRSAESHVRAFRELVAAETPLQVCDAIDKMPLEPGCIYLAPPEFHTLVEGDHLALTTDAAVSYSRPSIDVLFETAAESRGARCVGVVLTGANADGAAGLTRIVELGGVAVIEDPTTAERREMPRAALKAVPDARVAPLAEIAGVVAQLCSPSEVAA